MFRITLGLLCWMIVAVQVAHAQKKEGVPVAEAAAKEEFPDLTLPNQATVDELVAHVEKAKAARPQSPEQYKAMQTAIRDGSKAIVEQLKDKQDSRHRQAEMDLIASSVALMTYFSEKEQKALVEQIHEFLKAREKLSIQDIQTGMMAANMLELQSNKKPARDTYQLLDELLAEDERPEMQALRLNLQAAVRRLNLLGNKLELAAKSIDGKNVSIDDYAGKFVVVDFFATWCEPCLAEIPRLKKHYEKYREKGLEVVGVSLDGDRESLDAFLNRADLPWPIVHDHAEDAMDTLQMKFGVSSLPTVLLLNKEGTVVSLEARGAELDRIVEMLFEAPTPAAPAPTTAGEAAE